MEPGAAAETIDQVAKDREADLIVIAGHKRRPFEAFALGSVTAEVLCSAPSPVWVSLHEERGPAPRSEGYFARLGCRIPPARPWIGHCNSPMPSRQRRDPRRC
jgi:hypothetical protein